MALVLDDPVDAAVRDVRAGAESWARRGPAELAALLRLVRQRAGRLAHAWVEAACAIKGIEADGPLAGEEWLTGPYAVAEACGAYAASLDALAQGRLPFPDGAVRTERGRTLVRAFPLNFADRILYGGVSAEIRLRPGVEASVLRAGIRAAAAPRDRGSVGVVLGAGNVTAIAPLDVLDALVRHRRVVVLKPHPVLAPLDRIVADLLAPLIDVGAVRIVGGGAAIGAQLAAHAGIDALHLTGGERTYDAVVFGTGDEGAARKRTDEPLVRAAVTAELGNVSPVIVVPGTWSAGDLRYRAQLVATQKLHNAGANCIAAQVVITQRGWAQGPAFVAAIGEALRAAAPRGMWYPGVAARFPDYTGPAVRTVAHDARDPLLSDEAFAPLLAHVELDATDVPAFLHHAVAYCETRLPGSLGANVIVDAATARTHAAALEDAIDGLHHGCVAINAWTGLGFLLPAATWGAYPGNARNAAQSGIGIVHDALLIPDDLVERTIVRAPARIRPMPAWFVGHPGGTKVGAALTAYAVGPSPRRLFAVLAAALGR